GHGHAAGVVPGRRRAERALADGGSQGTFSASAPGYHAGSVTVTEALAAASKSTYDQWFLNLYDAMMNPANGYFSPKGIPYHSVETLIVEAPDYGHQTTSETYRDR